jgi:hypothetical protein
MHNTHPLLSYFPKESNWRSWLYGIGWTPKTYTAEDGTVVSWHELRSRSGVYRDTWGVEATFTGGCGILIALGMLILSRHIAGSVAVYGVPKAQITNAGHLGNVCVRVDSGSCEIVDVRLAYLNSEHDHEPVLLWRHDALDPSRRTQLSIYLVKASDETNVFLFYAIHYFESQEYAR